MMNIGFNDVFVSVCEVNLSAQLLHVVMVKKYSSKAGGTQLQKRSRSGTQKAKGWEPLFRSSTKHKLSTRGVQILDIFNKCRCSWLIWCIGP